MKYIVIGLGNFGLVLSTRLTELGHEVIGIDRDMTRVEQYKDKITSTICMDTNDSHSLGMLPLDECDAVVVAIGEDFGSSVMTAAHLKHMGVKRIIGRAINELHSTVLSAIGVTEILTPEKDSAERFAKKIQLTGVIDSFQLSEKCAILEVPVPEAYWGDTIEEVDLENRFKVKLVTVKRKVPQKNLFGQITEVSQVLTELSKELILMQGDSFVVFGAMKDLQRMFDLSV